METPGDLRRHRAHYDVTIIDKYEGSQQLFSLQDIKNNAWVTVNNDFWLTSEVICQ